MDDWRPNDADLDADAFVNMQRLMHWLTDDLGLTEADAATVFWELPFGPYLFEPVRRDEGGWHLAVLRSTDRVLQARITVREAPGGLSDPKNVEDLISLARWTRAEMPEVEGYDKSPRT